MWHTWAGRGELGRRMAYSSVWILLTKRLFEYLAGHLQDMD